MFALKGQEVLCKCAIGIMVWSLLVLLPENVSAQYPELDQAYRQGMALHKKGQYKEAIPFFQKALELGEREFGPDHKTTAIYINNLALLYDNQGRYADAEPLYKRSLAIWEKALGPEHPDVAFESPESP